MKKKIIGIITILLLLLSPLIGIFLGRIYILVAEYFAIWRVSEMFYFVTPIALIAACIIFYFTFSKSEN